MIEHEGNPRQLSKKAALDLKKSFDQFGYVELVAINADNTILAGHQRIYTLKSLGHADEEIEVRVPSRQLSQKEAREYLIRSNKNTGDWDYDLLSNWDIDELHEWGFTKNDLGIDGADEPNKPEEEEEEKTVIRVEVDCSSEADFNRLSMYLENSGFEFRKFKK